MLNLRWTASKAGTRGGTYRRKNLKLLKDEVKRARSSREIVGSKRRKKKAAVGKKCPDRGKEIKGTPRTKYFLNNCDGEVSAAGGESTWQLQQKGKERQQGKLKGADRKARLPPAGERRRAKEKLTRWEDRYQGEEVQG